MAVRKGLTNTDDLLSSAKARGKVMQVDKPDTGSRAKAGRTKSAVSPKHTELQVQALTDIKAFADLIKFHGGWDKFGECHDELAAFVTQPQVDKHAMQLLEWLGDEYEAGLRRLVLMPRGHLKSTVGTVLYTLWRIYRNADIRILVACNLQSLAFSFIREVRSYLENPELESVWNNRPHVTGRLLPALDKRNRTRNFSLDTEAEDRKVIWNNTALQVLRKGSFKEPTVFATSVGTTVTGMHYDLVILDDLVDFKNVESEVKKAQVEEWIADIESVLNPPEVVTIADNSMDLKDTLGGEILINGTRYALDDYYGQVLEKAQELGYKCHIRNIFKNGTDAADGYLWHEKYNDKIVASLQARLSPRRFSSQYLNRVYEKDAALFAVGSIRIIPDDCFFVNGGNSYFKVPGTNRIERVYPIVTIDPAFSTSKTSDDCAILTGFKLSDGTLVVQDADLDRMIAAEVVSFTQKHCIAMNTLRVYYEENGVGMLVGELFRNTNAYIDGKPILTFGHYEQRVKESKIQGILELPVAAGKVWFTEKLRAKEHIWKQLQNYPAVRHDDFLDGLVTLFEQATPAREVFDPTLQNISIDGIKLGIDKRLEDRGIIGKLKESFLAQFNSFFTSMAYEPELSPEQTINSLISDIVTSERNARTMLNSKWVELWSLYRTKPLRIQGDDGWQSKLNDGRVFEIIETVGAYFRNALFYSDNWVELESREPGLAEVTPLASAYFRDCLNNSNLWRELRVATTQLLLTGFTAMRVFWDDDEGLKFDVLNATDLYIESGRRFDPKYSYAFREYSLNKGEFLDWCESGLFNELDEDPDKAFARYAEMYRAKNKNWINDVGDVTEYETVEVIEFYDPIDKCLYRIIDEYVLHEEEDIDESPWVIATLFETPEDAYGASIVDSSIGLVLENNILMNRRLDNIAVSVDNMWLFVDDGVTDPASIRTAPGRVITVARPDVLQPLHPPHNNFNVTYQEASVLDAKIDRNIGTGAMISANTYRSGERVTAQEIQSVKEAGGNRLTDVYELFEKALIIPLLHRSYKLVRESTKKPKTIKLKGDTPNVYKYFQMLPEDLRKDYRIKVAASQNVINRDRRVSLITEFVTLVGSVPQFAELMDWGAVFQDLLTSFGFDDPGKYIMKQEAPAAPAPANPMEAMQQGLTGIGGEAYGQAMQEKVAGGQMPDALRTLMGQQPTGGADAAEDSAMMAGMMMPT